MGFYLSSDFCLNHKDIFNDSFDFTDNSFQRYIGKLKKNFFCLVFLEHIKTGVNKFQKTQKFSSLDDQIISPQLSCVKYVTLQNM